jgi:hypothetical protein
MPDSSTHAIDEIRAYLLREFFALPSRRRAEAARQYPAPEPAGDRHFRQEDIRWICHAALTSLGFRRAESPRENAMAFLRKTGPGETQVIEIRWDEQTGLTDPMQDIVETDPACVSPWKTPRLDPSSGGFSSGSRPESPPF